MLGALTMLVRAFVTRTATTATDGSWSAADSACAASETSSSSGTCYWAWYRSGSSISGQADYSAWTAHFTFEALPRWPQARAGPSRPTPASRSAPTYFSPRTMPLSSTAIRSERVCVIAKDVQIMADDWHCLSIGGLSWPRSIPGVIGDDVRIAAHVTILKGSVIRDGCVVAAGPVVTGRFDEPGCLLVGGPAGRQKGCQWIGLRQRTHGPNGIIALFLQR